MRIFAIVCLLALSTAAAFGQSASMTMEQRIGLEVGPIIARAAIAAEENDRLKAQLAEASKREDFLTKQLEEKIKACPGPAKPAQICAGCNGRSG